MVERAPHSNDWENQALLHINREPARVCLLPYSNRATALAGERSRSPFFRLLNGRWRFHYSLRPEDAPAIDEALAACAEDWDTIPLPSNWQMRGYGAVVSFELADAATADAVCGAVRVIESATSLGGVESSMERREKAPGQAHIPPGLIRLSVGCEHVEDLWDDLSSAIATATTSRS